VGEDRVADGHDGGGALLDEVDAVRRIALAHQRLAAGQLLPFEQRQGGVDEAVIDAAEDAGQTGGQGLALVLRNHQGAEDALRAQPRDVT
jgi:hypothetical protein